MPVKVSGKELYYRSPTIIQNIAISAKGLQLRHRRFGGEFDALLEKAKARQAWTEEQIDRYRTQRLKRFLKVANTSPFWNNRFQEHGVSIQTDDPLNQLKKLPVLSKNELKQADARVQPDNLEGKLLSCSTSGTTGSGLKFYQTQRALREKHAIWWRHRQWHGIERGTWQGTFTGAPIVPLNQSNPPFWRVDYPNRRVRYSTYHLRPNSVKAYIESIRDRDLPWLHGYPSSLALLGEMMLEQDISPPGTIENVTIGAETLLEHQRETIQEAFDAPITFHYGLAESVANISHCPEGNLHVDEDFAHVEFVPHETVEGHRIIGCNWTNPAFPLIRYDTGDIATLSDHPCGCGRSGRIVEAIEGRKEDYIVLPNGARVGRLDHIFKPFEAIREAQIYQQSRESVVLRVVRGHNYSRTTDSKLRKKARSRLGDEIKIEIEYVDEIDRTQSGKMKFVVSDVDDMRIETPTS